MFNVKTLFIKTNVSRLFPFVRRNITINGKQSCPQSILALNTNVTKDVILFRYENPKYFKYLSLFGLSQFGFWMYLSHLSFTTLRDAPVVEDKSADLPWWRKVNLGEQKYRNGISLFCGSLGYLFLIASLAYTIRSVRYVVLRKGGKSVSFVCYGPFGLKNSIMDVPLKNVSASESREIAKVNLPVKVKGKFFYYMLDMRGEFLNKSLFDATVGLKRKLSNS